MEKGPFSPKRKIVQTLIRQIRLEAKLTQAEVSARLGKQANFVSKCERGERLLDIVELDYLCAAMGVALEEFVRRYEEANREG